MAALALAGCAGTRSAAPVSLQLAGQDPRAASVAVAGYVVEPVRVQPTPERLARLRVPDGFEVSVWARDLVNPRMLAVSDDGTVYVTRRSVGDVLMLRDTNGDGTADVRETVASRPDMHGIAISGRTMYLTTIHDVYRTTIEADGRLGPLDRIVDDLPDAGQHPNRMVLVGPDGKLYLTAGSTCNACNEGNPENATLLRIEPDGSARTIYASGLRNTIGYGFEPASGLLYGMDHGIDWLGDNEQSEELNQIVEGNAYGWPYIYADGQSNPQDDPPGKLTMADWDARSARPLGLYTPHAAPMQLAFYTGSAFPAAYRGDAYVAMRGSWNRSEPSGYEVARVRFENGRPAGFEPFVTGFLMQDGDRWSQMARLAGLAQTRDGALLVTDDQNGVIYRIAYTGQGSGRAPAQTTNQGAARVGLTAAAAARAPTPTPQALMATLVDAPAARLTVSSPAFAANARIPDAHAADGQNASPALSWSAGPAGTQSYAVVVEDPDAAMPKPFVHWTLYNVPASVTVLEEGIPGAPSLVVPEGALQGANSYGSIGYYGPRPPVGDPPHRYHVQVFALDSVLSVPFGASRAELMAALRSHVLARGETVGTYQR